MPTPHKIPAILVFFKYFTLNYLPSGDIPLSNVMSYYLSNLSLEETCEWAHQSLNLPRLKTETLMKIWLGNCSAAEKMKSSNIPVSISPLPSAEPTPTKQPKFIRSLKVDPLSEILDEDDCSNIDKWLPEWVQGNILKCLFQASKHGYKLAYCVCI